MAKLPALGTTNLMAIIENRPYFDSLDDEVSRLLAEVDPMDRQDVYRKAKKSLRALVLRRRGVMLRFRKERLALVGTNDSVLIKIGPKKRGHLAAYRGHWIRVIWFGTYSFSMDCLVHKVRMTEAAEAKLIPRGPYTKEEFTDEVAKAYALPYATVDGLELVRSAKGAWVSSIPTDRALENLEKDEIPDGVTYQKLTPSEHGPYPTAVSYHKYGGFWIKTDAKREDITSGMLDWMPPGGRVYVERSGDIPPGWNVRTKDGWRLEP